MTFKQWLHDAAERSLSTLVQSAIVYFLAAQASNYGDWKALIAALFPAVGSVIIAALTSTLPTIQNYWADVSFRIVRTLIVTVLGAMMADLADLFQVSVWRTAFIAGGSAVLVVVKAEIAKRKSAPTITPASLAKAV